MTLQRALGFLVGLVARAWLRTLRLTLVVHPDLAAASCRPWVYVLWHGQQFALLRYARPRPTAALVSRSRDGEVLAAAFRLVGLDAARGSSSRSGASGLRAIVRRLRGGCDAAFAVDGPRGPRGVVRSEAGRAGAAVAATLAGGVLVPMASACVRRVVFRRAWDLFELPLPWSRVSVVLGAPLEPRRASPERIASAIDACAAEAARIALDAPTPASLPEASRS
jgi:lysophospholipid acyltransferase (LPLAT)-like uncharacterized protein